MQQQSAQYPTAFEDDNSNRKKTLRKGNHCRVWYGQKTFYTTMCYFCSFLMVVSVESTSTYISLQPPAPSTEHLLSQISLYSIDSSSFLPQHTSFPFSDPFLSPDHSDLPSDPWAQPSLLRRSVGHIDGSESILPLCLEGHIHEACQEKGGVGRKRR